MTDNLDVTTGQTQQELVETAETVTESMTDTSTDAKPKQTREQNSEFARQRRERELNEKLEQARMEAVFEAYDRKNPYTHEEMKDMEDYKEFLDMKQLEREGKDPISGRSDLLKERARKEAESKRREEESRQGLQTMLDEFKTKYPDVNPEELLNDEDFKDYASGKIGGDKSLSGVYESYLKLQARFEEKANRKAAQNLANAKASPGSATGSGTTEEQYYSYEDVLKMTPEERHRNFDAIMRSKKKWK